MKNLKIALCALLVLCSGIMFAACGGGKKEFDEAKISVGSVSQVEYDGNSHIFTVSYKDVKDLTVTYSQARNGTFVSAANLGLVDAGDYEIYYKLSADGYEAYVSETPVSFSITKRLYDFKYSSSNYTFNVNNDFDEHAVISYNDNSIARDHIVPTYNIHSNKDGNLKLPTKKEELENLANEEYKIELVGIDGDGVNNYEFSTENGYETANLKLIDNVLMTHNGKETYYHTLKEAINNAEDNDVIQLNADVEVDDVIEFEHSIKIIGNGHKITVSNEYEPTFADDTDSRYIFLNKFDITLTLQNIVIDGGNKVTCIKMSNGKLILADKAKITNGKRCVVGLETVREVDKLVGGVYITGTSQLEMKGGEISGNSNAEEQLTNNYLQYASDLWIGSQASATIEAGKIGNMFINSNSSKFEDAQTIVKGGAEITNAYVEFDTNNQAKLVVENNNLIQNIIVKIGNGDTAENYITYSNNQAVKGEYYGGVGLKSITINDVVYRDLQTAIDNAQDNAIITLYNNIEVKEQINVPANKKFTIKSVEDKLYSITAANDFVGDTILKVKNVSGVEITLQDVTIDGNNKAACVYVDNAKLTLKSGTSITNGITIVNLGDSSFEEIDNPQKLNGGVYVTGTSTFLMEGGTIADNSNAVNNGAMFGEDNYYKFAKDLWLGSQVNATISGGYVENVWVNANSKQLPERTVEIKDSAIVENAYLEYYWDNGKPYAATLQYTHSSTETNIQDSGLKNLHLSLAYEQDEIENKTYFTVENPAINNYTGGIVAEVKAVVKEGFEVPEKDKKNLQTLYLNMETLNLYFGSADISSQDTPEFLEAMKITLLANLQFSATTVIKFNTIIDGADHIIKAVTGENGEFAAVTEGTYEGGEHQQLPNRSLFMIPYGENYKNITITLNNLTLDGNGIARGISAYKGQFNLNSVTIQNGKDNDSSWSGGAFITSDAKLNLNNCTINTNVEYNEQTETEKYEANPYDAEYISDLWVGANAFVNVESSTIGGVWVNANKFSANNPGKLTLTSGTIDRLWLEYDKNEQGEYFGAVLEFVDGAINKLAIAQDSTNVEPAIINNPVKGNYVGGANAFYTKEDETVVYDKLEKLAGIDGVTSIEIIANATVSKAIIVEGKELTISSKTENLVVKANSAFTKETLNDKELATIFYVKQGATLTINNLELKGGNVARAISSFDATINLTDVKVTNGLRNDNYRSGGVFLTGYSTANFNNCEISENSYLDGENQNLTYSADMWIGSQATAIINGGTVSNVFVNANEYSTGETNLTIKGNAEITAMWVEYDQQNGAHVTLESGTIETCYVAQGNDNSSYWTTSDLTVQDSDPKTITGGNDPTTME